MWPLFPANDRLRHKINVSAAISHSSIKSYRASQHRIPHQFQPITPMASSRPRRDPSSEAYDPQTLTLGGKISALIALGRIPLASECPLWCLFGCLTASQIFEGANANGQGPFKYWDWWATLQCMLIVWGTNISINYGTSRSPTTHWVWRPN